jgi:LEA14-like dessication related protein
MLLGAREGRSAAALTVSAGGAVHHVRATLGLALCAALSCGCAHTPPLDPPRVSILGMHVVSGELWVQHLTVRLRLHNPNDRDLPVTGLEYTVEIAGQELGSGSSAESFVVPPHGDAELDTSVVTNLAAAALKLLSHGPRTLVPYRLAGKVSLAQGLGRVPFEERASFTP